MKSTLFFIYILNALALFHVTIADTSPEMISDIQEEVNSYIASIMGNLRQTYLVLSKFSEKFDISLNFIRDNNAIILNKIEYEMIPIYDEVNNIITNAHEAGIDVEECHFIFTSRIANETNKYNNLTKNVLGDQTLFYNTNAGEIRFSADQAQANYYNLRDDSHRCSGELNCLEDILMQLKELYFLVSTTNSELGFKCTQIVNMANDAVELMKKQEKMLLLNLFGNENSTSAMHVFEDCVNDKLTY